LHEVPIIILELNDNESLEVAIVENIQRDDLNIIEEAKGYRRLSDEFGYDHEKIARFMSKSRSHISNTLRLLSLPLDVIGMIEEGNLTAGQARPLIGLPSATNIAEEVVKKNLSARSVEILVRNEKGPQKVGQIKVDANILSEQNKIQDNLGLNVSIQNKRNNSGKITILYKNLEQFELISNLLKRN
jgi:ParB family chromosome partitioning protein